MGPLVGFPWQLRYVADTADTKISCVYMVMITSTQKVVHRGIYRGKPNTA